VQEWIDCCRAPLGEPLNKFHATTLSDAKTLDSEVPHTKQLTFGAADCAAQAQDNPQGLCVHAEIDAVVSRAADLVQLIEPAHLDA
jgi:hypothetical protein